MHEGNGASVVLSVLALLAGGLLAVLAAIDTGHLGLAVAVAAALAVRLQGPSSAWRRGGGVGLVLMVAATVGVVGGPTSPLLGALLVVVAEHARREPPEWVVSVGVAASAAVATATVVTLGAGAVHPSWAWPLALVPLTGLTAARTFRWRGDDSTAELESATAALDEVLGLAERMPAGFDRWSVAIAVHEEIREVVRQGGGLQTVQPHLLLVVDDLLLGVGNPIARRPVGLIADMPRQRRGQTWAELRGTDLPAGLESFLGGERWCVHHLGIDETNGVVLVPAGISRAALDAVADVLRPAAVALGNVQRFERLEALALSAARVRLAHDLHDGVAQALTHVRFELDLLGLSRPESRDELAQIRAVADAALVEVRRTVDELRESVPVGERLERHVALLSTFAAPDIQLHVETPVPLPGATADEVFRIAQEALSNVIRHSGASLARVSLTSDDEGITLTVIDDGHGMPARAGAGVGVHAMRSRARRIGGTLLHRDRSGGGTVVVLEAPRPLTTPRPAERSTGTPDEARSLA